MFRVAVVGKGGSGKTVLTCLLARALAERGLLVLAVDLDNNPGLALSLGIPVSDTPFPDEAVEPRADTPYGWGLARHLSPAEAVRRYAVPAGDRIRFLGFGNNATLDTPVTRYLTAVRHVAATFDEPGWAVVADLAAGPTNPYEGYARFATLALVAMEPTAAAAVTARGLLAILGHDEVPAELILTKVVADDRRVLEPDLVPFAQVPFDHEVRRLERRGSLRALTGESPALGAVRDIVTRIGL